LGLIATSLSKLNRLFLSKCHITDQGLLNLALAPSLSLFDISGCGEVTDAGMSHLVFLSSLCSLMLSESQVSSKGITTLSRLSSLESLNVYRCPKLARPAITLLRLSSIRLIVNCDFDRPESNSGWNEGELTETGGER